MIRVLVADDQQVVRHNLRRILESEPDVRVVGEAADGVAAIELARVLLIEGVRAAVAGDMLISRSSRCPWSASPTLKVLVTSQRAVRISGG